MALEGKLKTRERDLRFLTESLGEVSLRDRGSMSLEQGLISPRPHLTLLRPLEAFDKVLRFVKIAIDRTVAFVIELSMLVLSVEIRAT